MKNIIKHRRRAAKGFKTCAVAFSLLVLVSTGTSWAFTTYDGYQDIPPLKAVNVAFQPDLQYQPSSTVTDSCLSLLKSIHKTPSKSVTDRNQRSAGKVAALGLIFGVRYALTPPGSVPAQKALTNETQSNFDVWQHNGHSISGDNRPALAVSAYRKCQKKQALNALNDLR